MTPKEKAKELVDKYVLLPISFPYNDTQDGQCIGSGYMIYNSAKQCALIAIDEIIAKHYDDWDSYSEYWQEVKRHIKEGGR